MQMKLPQRWSRNFPLLAAAVFLIFLIPTASRLRFGSYLPPAVFPGNGPPWLKSADGDSGDANQKPQRPPPYRLPVAPGQCLAEIDFLRRVDLDLSDSIVYSRRCVKSKPSADYDRTVVANISKPLITYTSTVNLTDCSVLEPIPCDDLLLEVPPPYPPQNYNHLVFGIASTYDRVNESLPAFAHWLSDTDALLLGVIVDAESEEHRPMYNLTALEQEYAAAGVKTSFIPPTHKKHPATGEPDTRTEHHHFMLIRDLLALSGPDTRWLGVLDDDTFFPSLYTLDQELKNYDHTKSMWLGALSDSFDSVKNWGFMAYGGAGVFLSLPLARELEPKLERCINETTIDTGDGILRDCVYTTHTKLTLVPGLYQHDTQGDMSGFFESGVRPLSVHHWKSWYKEPMPKMAAITRVCGDCFLARWRFANDTLFANGYSITKYAPGVLDSIDLGKMEGTFANAGHDFDFSLGPLRERLEKDEKKSYRLRDIRVSDDGSFSQIYVYRGDDEKEEVDEVVELVWETD